MIRRRITKSVDTEQQVIEKEPIIKAVEFPNKEFTTKDELFNHLSENEKDLISLKTSAIKYSDNCKFDLSSDDGETKEIKGLEVGKIAAIINTTNFIDSHNDVHLPKIWNRSLKSQKGKIYYVADHALKLDSVIAFPKDVEMSVQTLSWKDLGQKFEGNTDALIYIVPIDRIKNEKALEVIKDKIDIEHSVRMQYVKILLCMDSNLKDHKEYKKNYDKYINEVANKELAEDIGYFWVVLEAKIFKEGSMVLFGSNDATPLMHAKDNDSTKVYEDEDSSKDTTESEEKKVTHRRRR